MMTNMHHCSFRIKIQSAVLLLHCPCPASSGSPCLAKINKRILQNKGFIFYPPGAIKKKSRTRLKIV
jgi:hypothetical protein